MATMSRPIAVLITATASVAALLVGGAVSIWSERGWQILIDLQSITAHALCL